MINEKPNETPQSNERPGTENGDWRDARRARRRELREKRWSEPLHGLFWGLLLVTLGLLFLANQQGWLADDNWWQYLLVGLGGVFIIDGLAHYFVSNRNYSIGRFIPGVVLLFVGLAFIVGFSEWWPAVLIGVGVVLLLSLLFRRR